VVRALRAAIAAGDSPELRAALGERLLVLESPAAALESFEAGLVLDARSAACLEGAARTAVLLGDGAKANAYTLALKGIRAAKIGSPPESAAPFGLPLQTLATFEAPPPAPDTTPRDPPRLHVVSDEEAEMVPPLRLADVGGMEEVKEHLARSFLTPLRNPDPVGKPGQPLRGGLLLYGPAGCGKTFLARAVAGEIGARFVTLALDDLVAGSFDESERKLHEVFDKARRQKPAVVFLDEADALRQSRSQLEDGAEPTLTNSLVAEMERPDESNEGLFLLAATSHPWDVDPALRRPGLFDRLLFVPPPDARARRAILESKLRDRLVAGGTVDLEAVAKATEGFSGADLAAVVGAAAAMALEASVKGGTEVPIDDELLRRAVQKAQPSTGPWLEAARSHAPSANEGGVYDELLDRLKQ